jgi:outer membrane protein assembly factor BamB
VGSNDDKAYALDAATGTLRWSYTIRGAVPADLAVTAGVVYVGKPG